MNEHPYIRAACAALLMFSVATGAGALEPDSLQPGHIEGVVIEAGTGDPLPAVLVRIAEMRRQELTHEDGSFRLPDIAPGRYTLVLERLGFRSLRQPVEVRAGERVRLRIEMESTPIVIPGLVITGTIGARPHDEVLRPTDVLAGLDLARQLDHTLAGTLERQAGVSSASMGPAPARPVIRGLGGDRILILEDGERVGDVSYTSADHAVALDPISAARVEVVRGPQALFYGSNALGGVINLVREEIPASLPDRLHGRFSLQGQSVNTGAAGEAELTAALGTVATRLETSYRGAGDMRTPIGALENTEIRTFGGGVGASHISQRGHLGAAYRLYDSRYGIPPDSVSGHAFGVDVAMRRHALRGELRRFGGMGPFSLGGADASYTWYHHQELEPSAAGPVLGTEYFLQTGSLQGALEHQGLAFLDRGAVGARGEWRNYEFNTGRAVVRSRELSGAVFFLEETAWHNLLFQAGGRYDWRRIVPLTEGDERTGPVLTRMFGSVSGSVATLADLGHGVYVGGSVSRAFRTPSSDELFSRGPHLATYTFEVGNPNLREETALGMDALFRVERGDLHVELAAFQNRINGFIQTENTGELRQGLFVYRFVNREARFRGWEAVVQTTPVRWLALEMAAASVSASEVDTGEPLPFIPPLNGRVSGRVERASTFAGLGWRGAARQDRVPTPPEDIAAFELLPPEFVPTAGYGVFDATAGYHWSRRGQLHTLTLRVDNVTNVEYRNHLSRLKTFMPEAGRGVTLLYRVSF
jgi:iron complex outermembrane recepter protein